MGFAFACHPGIIQIMHDLDRNTPQRMAKVLSRALSLCAGLYALVGLAGYARFRDRTGGDILRNFGSPGSPPGVRAFEHGLKTCFGMTVVASAPSLLIPLHDTLAPAFFKKRPPTRRQSRMLIAAIVLACFGIAVVVPNVELIFSL